jgi:CubicO group peptidase (beta-lactamase class C family)
VTPLLLALLGLAPPVERALDAFSEPGCPRLFALLTPSFQRAVPVEKWPAFCDGVGKLESIAAAGQRDGWPIYRARSKRGEWEIGLALDGERVSGLYARPWREPETARSLDEKLAAVGQRHRLPGAAALSVVGGRVVAQAAWGVRKLGDPTKVTAQDRWHLGSDGKAMTATLAALLVADGKIAWRSTVGELFRDWKELHPGFAAVTLEQLLGHRGGLAHETPPPIWADLWAAKDPVAGRTRAVRALLARGPGRVGEYVYANDGYLVAGVMLERAGGKPWEVLLGERLFAPLGMRSCGFGVPATAGTVDAPWAHRDAAGTLEPVAPPRGDNPPGVGPAGTVHCALGDWARFASEHVRGERGEPTTLALDAAAWRKLHAPLAGGDYALGWAVGHAPWANGPVFAHDGSNTMFYASVAAAPARDAVLLFATNRGGDEAERAAHEVIDYLGAQLAR